MAIASEQMTIQRLPKGVTARVAQVEGCDDEVARLAELGLHDGAIVSVIRRGSPCIIQVNTSRICVRTSRDLTVLVSPID